MHELLFSSQQLKAKNVRRHCFSVLFPHLWQQFSYKSHAMKLEGFTDRAQALRLQMRPINKKFWGPIKSINRPLSKRMQQLHCLMVIYKIVNRKTLHCKNKEMCISPNSATLLSIVMFLLQRIQAKATLSWLLRKIPPPRNMSFMSISTTLRGYNDGSLTQKGDGLKQNTPIIDL